MIKYKIGAAKEILNNLHRKILKYKVIAFDQMKTGEIINRFRHDSEKITSMSEQIVVTLVYGSRLFFILILIFYIQFYLGLIILIALIIHYFNFKKYGIIINKIEKERAVRDDSYISSLQQTISGIREIKSLRVKNNVYKVLQNNYEQVKDYEQIKSFSWLKENTVMQITKFLSKYFGLIVSVIFFLNGQLGIEYVIAISVYYELLGYAISGIGNFSVNLKELEVSIDRVNEILYNKHFDDEKFGDKELKEVKGFLTFDKVSFAYGSNQVFEDLTLAIKPNSITAIIGRSGVGKTTIFNLILRFYDVDKGTIKIDDTNIYELNEESLRGHISIIRQDSFLFNLSIKDNLKLVKDSLTETEMVDVCQKARIHDFIISLEKGYDTIIGEGSVNLSGGQKQRLAIARALITKSKLILLDEATSSLDNESQRLIQETIKSLKENHTIIIIAHRLSTIKEADNILVINNKKVQIQGNHDYLIKNSELYANLYYEESLLGE